MEKISALMDGELDARDTHQTLARLKQDPEARARWDTFHLIGSTIRRERAVGPDLARRVSARLAQEPTVLAPRAPRAMPAAPYALSAAASLAVVGIAGWVTLHERPDAQPDAVAATPTVLSAPAPAPAPAAQLASTPRDARTNEYLMLHQEYSPSTAIQGLAPYVRTVSGTQPASE